MDSTVLCQTPQSQLTLSAELRKVIHERNILTTRTRMKVLSELDGITRYSNEESQMSRRDKTIQEILTSEVSYLHQLELLTKYFMEPLKAMPCISSVEYMTLFGHLDTIYKVNGELLNEMKKTPNNIGEVFIKLAPFFKLYSVYAYDYKNVLKLLQDMQSNNPQLKEFIHQQETLPEVGTSLPALLITPIQRVPRYRLLLQEVLSLTPSTHPDYSVLQRSLLEVERTASHINNLVQEQESMQQMVELQRSLQNGRPSIVVPGRRLLKEGLLMKVSPHGKRAHCRYFVLFNDLLMYCKVVRPAAHRPRLLRCCCVLPLKKCRVDDVIGKGMFKVACQGETLLLYSASLEDTQGWVTALTAAVKQYHESRQTLRRDSSNRKPMRQGDFTLDLPTPILHVKCRKRRRSAVEDTGGASSSTSQENIFKKFIWRKSLQANPEKIAKFEDGDNSGKTENSADYKDSLYPLRDSLTRGKTLNSRENVEIPSELKDISEESNIVKPGSGIKSSGLNNEDCGNQKDSSDDVPDCVGFSAGARERMWNTMANLGRLIRKCIFRRVPRAPAFE